MLFKYVSTIEIKLHTHFTIFTINFKSLCILKCIYFITLILSYVCFYDIVLEFHDAKFVIIGNMHYSFSQYFTAEQSCRNKITQICNINKRVFVKINIKNN